MTAATGLRPRRFPATSVARWQRHYMNRLGWGFSRPTLRQLETDGSPRRWLEHQIARPGSIAEPATARALDGWFPDLDDPAATKWAANVAGTKAGWEYAADLARWSMLRRVYSAPTDTDDDLAVTTDYRNVLGEIIHRRFPDRRLGTVFPGFSYRPLGLMAA